MGESPEFESETNPIYKCAKCKWIFSPGDPSLPFMMQELLDEMTQLKEELRKARGE